MSKTIAVADGDFFWLPNGQMLEIEDTTKGDQDFAEEFLTEYIQDEDYGNDLFSFVGNAGGFLTIDHPIEAIASQKIRDCVARLQAQQQADPYSTADERIGSIVRLLIKDDPTSPTNSVLFYIELMTESGEIIGNTRGFQVSLRQAQPPNQVQIETQLDLNPTPPNK